MPLLLALLSAWLVAQAASSPASSPSPDYDFYKARVEPLFLEKRPEHARCVTCHAGSTTLRLQRLAPGAAAWTEEQSRQNFEAVKTLIVPGSPGASRLLRHPLSRSAGGDVFHGGGQHWTSKSDPEWQLYAYSLPDLKPLGNVHVGQHPEWLTFSPDGKRVYVAAAGDNAVSVVDVPTLKEVARIAVGQVPKRNDTALLQK